MNIKSFAEDALEGHTSLSQGLHVKNAIDISDVTACRIDGSRGGSFCGHCRGKRHAEQEIDQYKKERFQQKSLKAFFFRDKRPESGRRAPVRDEMEQMPYSFVDILQPAVCR